MRECRSDVSAQFLWIASNRADYLECCGVTGALRGTVARPSADGTDGETREGE